MSYQELQGALLQQAISDYLENYSVEKNWSRKTVLGKKDILPKLVSFLNGKPYTLQNVRAFITYKYSHGRNTPNSRADLTRIIRSFTNFLKERDYLEESFASKLEKPKVPKIEFDYVDPEIVDLIIEAGTEPTPEGIKGDNSRNRRIKTETRLALKFLLRTGLRINELLLLKGKDINLYDNPPSFWVNSKGGNRGLLPLPRDMIETLKTRITLERVFQVTDKTCNAALRRGIERMEVKAKITCHTLRHIFATSLTKQNIAIQLISRLLRHSSIEITVEYYQHLNVNDLSLVVNQQPIVREGLEVHEVLDLLEKTIRRTGIEMDRRFNIKWEHTEGRLMLDISSRGSQ